MQGPAAARRYIVTAAAAIPVCFALLWAHVAWFPSGYMGEDFPPRAAKRQMIDACDLGDVVVLGDSNAGAAVVPGLMSLKTTNLGMTNGKTIEAYYALKDALACPAPPRYALLSISLHEMTGLDTFWDSSARLRFLRPSELMEVHAFSAEIGDSTIDRLDSSEGSPRWLRNVAYDVDFPSIYSKSLIQSGLVGRTLGNMLDEAEYVARRGELAFFDRGSNGDVWSDGALPAFDVNPLLDAYFDRTVALAASRGMRVGYFVTPANASTAAAMGERLRDGFRSWLNRKLAMHPNLDILSAERTAWPDQFFGDKYGHLGRKGSALITHRLSDCIAGAVPEGFHPGAACQDLLAVPPG